MGHERVIATGVAGLAMIALGAYQLLGRQPEPSSYIQPPPATAVAEYHEAAEPTALPTPEPECDDTIISAFFRRDIGEEEHDALCAAVFSWSGSGDGLRSAEEALYFIRSNLDTLEDRGVDIASLMTASPESIIELRQRTDELERLLGKETAALYAQQSAQGEGCDALYIIHGPPRWSTNSKAATPDTGIALDILMGLGHNYDLQVLALNEWNDADRQRNQAVDDDLLLRAPGLAVHRDTADAWMNTHPDNVHRGLNQEEVHAMLYAASADPSIEKLCISGTFHGDGRGLVLSIDEQGEFTGTTFKQFLEPLYAGVAESGVDKVIVVRLNQCGGMPAVNNFFAAALNLEEEYGVQPALYLQIPSVNEERYHQIDIIDYLLASHVQFLESGNRDAQWERYNQVGEVQFIRGLPMDIKPIHIFQSEDRMDLEVRSYLLKDGDRYTLSPEEEALLWP